MRPGTAGTTGKFPGIPNEHSGGEPGRNGNRPFRAVPGFPPPMLAAVPMPRRKGESSESEIAGPSYRGAVGGSSSRDISIGEEK
jgi:hypothetical protein